jgi:hypothetical protein
MAKPARKHSIAEIFALGTPIDEACDAAFAKALRWHQWIGTPYPMWDGKKVVYVDPRTIRLPGEGKSRRKSGRSRTRRPARQAKSRRR